MFKITLFKMFIVRTFVLLQTFHFPPLAALVEGISLVHNPVFMSQGPMIPSGVCDLVYCAVQDVSG